MSKDSLNDNMTIKLISVKVDDFDPVPAIQLVDRFSEIIPVVDQRAYEVNPSKTILTAIVNLMPQYQRKN